MKQRIVILVSALLLIGGRAIAQGSTYNLVGFGTPVASSNPVIDALGGAAVALGDPRIINDINPADWTWLSRARFDVALRYEFNNETLGTAQDAQHNFNFSGISFGAPFWSSINASLALGYRPLTNANSEVDVNDSIGSRSYISRGGTNMIYLGVAARPIPAIALGARLDLITGNIRHTDFLSVTNTEQTSGQFERDYTHNGLRPTFGLELVGDSIGLPGFMIGASYSLPANLTSTLETIITPSTSLLDTSIATEGVGKLPAALTAGLSYRFSRRYRFEGDYSMQDYSTSYLYAPTSSTGDATLRAGSRLSFGVERLVNMNGEFGTSFGIDKWALRLGFSYATLPIIPAGSGGVNELALSAGLGIPFSIESMLNLGAVIGERVPTNTGQAPKETFLRLGASVSLSERWFVPTPRD